MYIIYMCKENTLAKKVKPLDLSLGTKLQLDALTFSPVCNRGFPGGSMVRNLPAKAGDFGSIPAPGRSPGGGNGNPLQYSCLGKSMDRGACRITEELDTWQSNNKKKPMPPQLGVSNQVNMCANALSTLRHRGLLHIECFLLSRREFHHLALMIRLYYKRRIAGLSVFILTRYRQLVL